MEATEIVAHEVLELLEEEAPITHAVRERLLPKLCALLSPYLERTTLPAPPPEAHWSEELSTVPGGRVIR